MFRRFILALRRNWQIVSIATLVVASTIVLGGFLFIRGQKLMEDQLRLSLRTVATLAAGQFDAREIDHVRTRSSMESKDFESVVARLRRIREEVPSIRFAYIMRRTTDPMTLEFVADADSLSTPEELDRDGDGTVDEDEEGSYPGDPYEIDEVPALQERAFVEPTVDDDFTVDQWGALISGYAPIRDGNGAAVAVIGIDMNAEEYVSLSRSMFSPVAFLLLTIVGFMLAGFVARFLWRRKVEELESIDAERSGLLQIAFHRLGGPLSVFQWSSEFLVDALEKGDAAGIRSAAEEHVASMQTGVRELSGILSELKEASDVETGRIAFRKELTPLHEVIEKVAGEFEALLGERKLHLHLRMDRSIRMHLDRKLIGGVVRELLRNAVTFSPDRAMITVIARRGGKCVVVEVRDEGCGIEKRDLKRVFQKFVRGAGAHLHEPNGSGLGLYIAKGIVERAGGEMWIESEPGKGTTVAFTLPC